MRALIVVDYQVDFVDGSLGSADAVSIEDAICSRIAEYTSAGDPVFFTRDTHGEDYLETREGRLLPVPHCIRGTPGWEFYGKVAGMTDGPGCSVIEKGTFGCSELAGLVAGCDEVELCGVATNICVIANAVIVRTACPEARVLVRRDCVASYDRGLGEKALEVMGSLQVEIG